FGSFSLVSSGSNSSSASPSAFLAFSSRRLRRYSLRYAFSSASYEALSTGSGSVVFGRFVLASEVSTFKL
ncbi:MAG: hypothetical protein ACKO96_30705, partial [Flammeovirgaceae bacterium]